MLHLLDANVLITANNSYYALDRVPEFWEWLADVGGRGNAKLPVEIYEEIKDGNDALAVWVRDPVNRNALLLDEEADPQIVARVIEHGYAVDLSDVEVEKIGRDPFLIAYALADKDRCVVTTEVSKPTAIRANRRIPDVCMGLGVKCKDTFTFLKALNFTTSWRP
ncbi:MAG: DUF4411 family protein [Methylocella sp.]